MKIKVGFGYDVHQLVEGRDFWLGGIKLDHHKGGLGHSDADVLIHAICDALLGAANLRDIGYHFPDNSADYKDIDSKILLKKVMGLLAEKGFKIGNIDCTISLETPKVNPHIQAMQKVLAEIMQIEEEDISIKATTGERMGFVGRKEGICAYVVALIYKD
jgi:2-C-methyl-D-erythritol 2,4-cyclodiphosphate synthase